MKKVIIKNTYAVDMHHSEIPIDERVVHCNKWNQQIPETTVLWQFMRTRVLQGCLCLVSIIQRQVDRGSMLHQG